MPSMPSLRLVIVRLLCAVCVIWALACSCACQTLFDGNQNLPPYGGFSGGQFDTVSLQNGNLHLHIPVGSWKQRGGKTIWMALEWDSLMYTRQTITITKNGQQDFQTIFHGPGTTGTLFAASNGFTWSASSAAVSQTCPGEPTNENVYPAWVVTDPENVQHPADVQTAQCPNDAGMQVLTGPTEDGTGVMLNLGSSPMITLKDGTQIPLTCTFAGDEECVASPGTIEDTNGNLVSDGSTMVDTLDRTLWTQTQGPSTTLATPKGTQLNSAAYTLYTITDSSGQARNYRIDYTAIDISSSFCGGLNNPPHHSCTEPNAPLVVPSKLTLPNGSTYQFSWIDSTFGQLGSITLPTGGTITYTYTQSCIAAPLLGYYTVQNVTYACRAIVASRTTSLNGVNSMWTYSVPTPSPVTVTDPIGNQQVHTFSPLNINNVPSPNSVETEVDYYQGSSSSGRLLKKVVTAYTGESIVQFGPGPHNLLGNVRPTSVTTTLDNGYVSQTQTDYETFLYSDQFANETGTRSNATEVREYDYGNGAPGPLLRRTDYTYLHNSNPTYANLNIVDRPTSIIVYNGAGNTVSQTQNEYDNYTAGIQPSGAVQHDAARGASYTTRGNVTAVERWRNTDGAWLIARNQYDDAGNVLTQTDPLSHSTQYSYADSWTLGGASCAPSGGQAAAFVTQVTNALNQKTNYSYFSCTGLQGKVTDSNSQMTSYAYDMFGRKTQANYPDTGQTTYCYTDEGGSNCTASAPPYSVVTTRKISSAQNYVTTDIYDGLGRVSEHLLSDPDCANGDRTDTTYDALGRISTVSNPYCSTSDPTYGLTMYGYDALNRTTQVTNSDNSVVTTSYIGRATEITDESGKQRISQVDGLGRLTSVCEVSSTPLAVGITGSTNPVTCGLDISGTGFPTTYGYDALDDLTSVTQAPLNPRVFNYDSLDELTGATNPESGTVTYTYDSGGNVVTKTDGRGITTCFGDWNGTSCNGTTGYDALNRLVKKTYSDGTPPVTYNYDQNSADGVTLTNTIGRKSSESTGGAYPTFSVFGYDSMGRITTNTQQAIQYPQAPSYTYDLLGNMITQTVPAAGTITNAYNGASRLSASTTNFTGNYGGVPTNLISAIHYNALGRAISQALGNSLNESWSYDDRERINSYAATNGSTAVYSYSLSYSPNGNMMSSNDNINGDWVYSYDDFNRLVSGSYTAAQYRHPASYSYVYDRFGNRWQQNVTSGTGTTSNLAFDANNHIIGSGITYDAAGNVTFDGTNTYTYNAEGRIATVPSLGTTYVYDAEGRRVAVVNSSQATCYSYDLEGHVTFQYICLNGAGRQREEYWIGGRQLVTYSSWPFFNHADWLGTNRYRSTPTGGLYGVCVNNPFGDNQYCSSADGDISPVHFTGKERDGGNTFSPTGLDNFGARYFTSGMGRFMTPDPLLNSGRPWDPQTWNRYAYARNNPLNIIDPTGLYDLVNNCASDDKKCNKQFNQHAKDLKNGLSNLQKQVDKMKDGAAKDRLEASLKVLGTQGDNNGVNVNFGSLAPGIPGQTTLDMSSNSLQINSINITLDPSKINGSNDYAIDFAHEGTHAEDFLTMGLSASGIFSVPDLSPFSIEYRGYQTSAFAAQALGVPSLSFGSNVIWNSSWAAADRQVLMDRGITNHVTSIPGHPETTPHNPWPF